MKNRQLILVKTFILSLVLFTHSFAIANDTWDCNHLLRVQGDAIDKPRTDFDHQPSRYTYSVVTSPIDNQCQYGNCWIYATDAEIEEHLITQGRGNINLSEAFVTVNAIKLRAFAALGAPRNSGLTQGGWYAGALWLIQTRGVIPESVWQPRVAFTAGKAPDRLMGFLNSRIAQYHIDAAVLAGTAGTEEQMAALLKTAQTDLLAIIEVYTGPIPKKFTIDGRLQTPLQYAREILPQGVRTVRISPKQEPLPGALNVLAIANRPSPPSHPEAIRSATDSTYALELEDMEALMISRLQSGKGVVAAIEVNRSYIDNATGIMSLDAFHNPVGFQPTPANYRSGFDQLFGGHLIHIIGVDVDAAGKVIKFKVKNSWGENSGDHGFYHMYADYAKHYLKGIYLRVNDLENSRLMHTGRL